MHGINEQAELEGAVWQIKDSRKFDCRSQLGNRMIGFCQKECGAGKNLEKLCRKYNFKGLFVYLRWQLRAKTAVLKLVHKPRCGREKSKPRDLLQLLQANAPSSKSMPSNQCLRLSTIKNRAVCYTALTMGFVLTACQPGILEPQGVIGKAEKIILIDSLVIMLAIVIPTIAATFVFAWWFQASNIKARYRPDWAYSGSLELIVWSIPVLVIMLLGGVTWIASHELDPAIPLKSNNPPFEVQVVSLDWKWLFIYPSQGIASVNQLVIPAATPIHFSLTSASVMNSFFIPQLGSMINTMYGMTTRLYLQADAPGTYQGLSSHFSGDGFADMHFDVIALSSESFTAWIEATRRTGPILDLEAYSGLAQQSLTAHPFTFHAVTNGLFRQIADQKLPPGPGPQ